MHAKKLFLMTLALTTLWTVVAAGTDKQPVPTAPKAVAPRASHMFGTVLEGLEVSHRFKILNEGDAALKIFNVRTD
jgi:hypothetical protein